MKIDTSGAHVLIVDDDEMLRDGIVYEFKKNGFRVSSASSGRQALTLLKADPASFVISDIRMPDGDGIELLAELKRNNPLIPFVFLVTGYSEITVSEARTRGADALLTKPFDRKALVKTVTDLLMQAGVVSVLPSECLSNCSATILNKNIVIAGGVMTITATGMFMSFSPEDLPDLNDEIHFKACVGGENITGNGVVTMLKIRSSEQSPSGCFIQFIRVNKAIAS